MVTIYSKRTMFLTLTTYARVIAFNGIRCPPRHKVSLQPRSQKGVEEKRRIAEGPSAGPAVAQGCKTCCHAQAVIGRAWRPACRPEQAGRSGGTSAGLRGAIIGLSNLPIMISMSRTMLEDSK
jgi:hypothetical protein